LYMSAVEQKMFGNAPCDYDVRIVGEVMLHVIMMI
jgi:hypothetical protein